MITTTLDSQSADSLRDSVLDLYSTDSTSVLMTNDDYDGLASQISWTAPTTRCLDSSSCIYFLTVSVTALATSCSPAHMTDRKNISAGAWIQRPRPWVIPRYT